MSRMSSQSKKRQPATLSADDDEGSAEQPRVKRVKRRRFGKKKAARANIKEEEQSSLEHASEDIESKGDEDAKDHGDTFADDWDCLAGTNPSIDVDADDVELPPPRPKRDVKALLGRSIVTNVSCGVCGASSEDYRVLVVSVHALQVNHSLRFSTKCSF